MAPVIPAPCWASRHHLMPSVPRQPVRRQRTPPAVGRRPRHARPHLESVPAPAPASQPSRSPSRRKVRIPAVRVHRRQPPPLRRTSSEPVLPSFCSEDDGEAGADATALSRFSTCLDVCSPGMVFPSPPPSVSPHSNLQEGAAATTAEGQGRYTDESKVVISVTVEGCPGPVRALVRLGATVEETIAIVAGIYQKEGRRPRLDDADRRGEGSLLLYHSYFCLQGLNNSDRLGDVGGRSFYLRRSSTNTHTNTNTNTASSSLSSTGNDTVPSVWFGPPTAIGGSLSCLIVSFLTKRLGKIGRRGRKIWNMLGCIASD